MSPEQVSGAPVDGRSDIFSLGVVLYEMLTNRKPFSGDNLTAISYKIVHEDFTPPGDLSPDIPQEFNPIVARAMAKDPWNRYQRGKDMALALYQLKAHLEEQKALQDLGTMVSAAENLPTLKLANLQELAAQGAPRDSTTSMPPPAAPPPPPPAEPPAASASWPEAGDDSSDHELTTAAPDLAAAMAASSFAGGADAPASTEPSYAGELPPLPPPGMTAPAGAPAQDWKKLAKAEVNPRWFWMVTAAAAGVLLVVVAFFALRAKVVSRPSAEPDAVLEQEVKDRRQSLDETKKLFAAGKYEESLAKARQVLSHSPNNEEARKYAQMAESAVQSQQAEEQKKQQAAVLVSAAKIALDDGKPDEAKRRSEEAIALDAGNAEAASLRDQADVKLNEAKVAAEAAARKKGAKTARDAQAAKKNAPAPSPAAHAAAATVPAAAPPPASVPATATLKVVFDAPIPEGHIMLAVNDQILLRRPFSFKKGEARNVVASISVPAGAAAVKVWLSGPDMASAFATTNAQLAGGDAKTLQLDYSGGKLSVHLQ